MAEKASLLLLIANIIILGVNVKLTTEGMKNLLQTKLKEK